MKQSIEDLMRKAAELKPQRPSNSKYKSLLPLFQQMDGAGHTHTSMAAFLVQQGVITSDKELNCRRSISGLLARHAKPVPANTTSTPKLP